MTSLGIIRATESGIRCHGDATYNRTHIPIQNPRVIKSDQNEVISIQRVEQVEPKSILYISSDKIVILIDRTSQSTSLDNNSLLN